MQIGGATGKQPKGDEKFSVKGAEWVVFDRDETLLTYRQRESKSGFELSRYDLEGNRLPCWDGEGKEGRWLERTFGAGGQEVHNLGHRWFRCRDNLAAKPGLDGSMFILIDWYNCFRVGRFTRDGQRQYNLFCDHHPHDFCGDAEGNVYVLAADWGDETKVSLPGGESIRRHYILRIGSGGVDPTVLADSVVKGGAITTEHRLLAGRNGTVHAFGWEDLHLHLAPDGTVLKASEASKRAADTWRKNLKERDD
ncbi:MAG: hypothetical protein ABI333_17200 [bacterium]